MKITGSATCPDCKKPHPVALDIDKLQIATPETPATVDNATTTGNTVLIKPEDKPKPEIKIETVSPSDEPYYACKNGNCDKGLHKNPNYSKKPKEKCENCGTSNGIKKCKNCGNIDPEEFETLDEDKLNELGIPEPVDHSEHGHD